MDDVARAVAEDREVLVLALDGEAARPPFLQAIELFVPEYQQRGRCIRLPPTVPMLRICGVPTPSAAVVSAG